MLELAAQAMMAVRHQAPLAPRLIVAQAATEFKSNWTYGQGPSTTAPPGPDALAVEEPIVLWMQNEVAVRSCSEIVAPSPALIWARPATEASAYPSWAAP